MSWHVRHPRDERQSVCGILADQITRWETEYPPRLDYTCVDCYDLLPDAERPDDYTHAPGDPAIIDSLRRILAERQHAKVNGVLIDLWTASVTILVWDRVKPHIHERLLTLPAIALIQQCVAIYSKATKKAAERDAST